MFQNPLSVKKKIKVLAETKIHHDIKMISVPPLSPSTTEFKKPRNLGKNRKILVNYLKS